MRRTPVYLYMSRPSGSRVHVDTFYLTVIRYYTGVIPDTGDLIASKNQEDFHLIGTGGGNSWSGYSLNTSYSSVSYNNNSTSVWNNLYEGAGAYITLSRLPSFWSSM